ncbi:MAG TPA: N-acyl homoserine lactonase family protein [Candidatus Limnocylindria bacterium]|nr:N-acyl homoserine lactonase family protein [Candidatus Limnocylindria bacterium]
MSPRSPIDIVALPMGEFTFPEGGDYAGQIGVVVAYAVRHPNGVFLFDTGFGTNNELAEYYKVRARDLAEVLAAAGLHLQEITAIANCHLHADHSGQNGRFPSVPIFVQPAEWAAAHEPDYTILDDIDFEGARYEQIAGDHEVAPGIRIFATPGHSPGHQSLVVATPNGPVLLAGQAVYSHGEWTGLAGAREGVSTAPDQPDYARSVERLRALNPARVLFGHDRRGWPE